MTTSVTTEASRPARPHPTRGYPRARGIRTPSRTLHGARGRDGAGHLARLQRGRLLPRHGRICGHRRRARRARVVDDRRPPVRLRERPARGRGRRAHALRGLDAHVRRMVRRDVPRAHRVRPVAALPPRARRRRADDRPPRRPASCPVGPRRRSVRHLRRRPHHPRAAGRVADPRDAPGRPAELSDHVLEHARPPRRDGLGRVPAPHLVAARAARRPRARRRSAPGARVHRLLHVLPRRDPRRSDRRRRLPAPRAPARRARGSDRRRARDGHRRRRVLGRRRPRRRRSDDGDRGRPGPDGRDRHRRLHGARRGPAPRARRAGPLGGGARDPSSRARAHGRDRGRARRRARRGRGRRRRAGHRRGPSGRSSPSRARSIPPAAAASASPSSATTVASTTGRSR